MAIPVLYQDPFSPILLATPSPSVVSVEQKMYVKKVLDRACSDSLFAEKAYIAITKILAGQSVVPPVVTSLSPNSAEIGDPSFVLHVHGVGFVVGSKIYFAGQEEPTTYVSATEVTTGVDMSVWLGPDVLPVVVVNPDGVSSAPSNFTFTI